MTVTKRIVLKPGRERSVLRLHPWVFSGAIASGEAGSGELVEVVSACGDRLGFGWHSPNSQIRVRMLGEVSGEGWLAGRVAASVARRADILSEGRTNAVRLVNAESDGLPGVVADCYAGFVVCQFTSAGADANKAAIAAALMASVPGCRGVSERTDLKDRAKEGLATGADGASFAVLVGEEPPAEIEIFEDGCRFLVDVRSGHKTGFYLDQRDARMLVGTLARGRTVLNCFCYTGGFGIAAAVGGAEHVTQVDISHDALELAKKNAELMFGAASLPIEQSNDPHSRTIIDHVEADVFDYLRKCRDSGRKFDLIVLDPPKFAASKGQVMKAARGYKDINLLAMKLLRPNGYLATFSCSGAMTRELFDQVLAEAALDAQRQFQVLARTRQGLDHPVAIAFPEGLYLKGVVLQAME